jgi:hypothetical protein
MRYLTWRLNWDDPHQGTQPSSAIPDGYRLQASMFANPDVQTGTILGYLTEGDVNLSALTPWQVAELTQAEALEFAQGIDPEAYLLPDGAIAAPIDEAAQP